MAAGRYVVELRGDADLIAAPAHAAFDDVAHAEIARDLVDVNRAAFVDKRRVAGDDEEPAQLRERGDDVLADPVGEILLGTIAAHVDEGQHGDTGSVAEQQRQWLALAMRRGKLRCDRARGSRLHVTDKAESLARDAADQRLRGPAVADCLARGVDPAGQGPFLFMPAPLYR